LKVEVGYDLGLSDACMEALATDSVAGVREPLMQEIAVCGASRRRGLMAIQGLQCWRWCLRPCRWHAGRRFCEAYRPRTWPERRRLQPARGISGALSGNLRQAAPWPAMISGIPLWHLGLAASLAS
jgi:hypothetical protein